MIARNIEVTGQHPKHKHYFSTLANYKIRVDVNLDSERTYIKCFNPAVGSYSKELKEGIAKQKILNFVRNYQQSL